MTINFKTNLVIDADNFVHIGEDGSEVGTPPSTVMIRDPIRVDYATNWYTQDTHTEVFNGYDEYPREEMSSDGGQAKVSIWPWNSDDLAVPETVATAFRLVNGDPSSTFPYGRFTETIIIAGDPGVWTDHESWASHVRDNYAVGVEHFDHCHRYSSPYTPREQIVADTGDIATATGQVRLDYNFYIPAYENAISYPATSETILPHLYTIYLDKQRLLEEAAPHEIVGSSATGGGRTPSLDEGIYYDFITLNSHIAGSLWAAFRLPPHIADIAGISGPASAGGRPDPREYIARTSGRYYESWSRVLPTVPRNDLFNQLTNKYSNLFVPAQTLVSMQNMNPNAPMFPMFADISFSLPPRPSVEEAPYYEYLNWIPSGEEEDDAPDEAEGYINNLMRGVFLDLNAGEAERVYTSDRWFLRSSEIVRDDLETGGRTMGTRSNWDSRPSVDLGDWVYNNSLGPGAVFPGPSGAPLPPDSEQPWLFLRNYLEGALSGFFNNIEVSTYADDILVRLRASLNNTITDGGLARSYKEVLRGVPAHSEDLFFKVSKYRVASNGARYETPIQTYYLPNIKASHERIRLIDTQLRYAETYDYEVTTYRLVFGSKSTYTEVQVGTSVSDHLAGPEREVDPAGAFYRAIFTDRDLITDPEYTGPIIMREIRDSWFPGGFLGSDEGRLASVTVETAPSIQIIELPYLSRGLNDGSLGGTVLDDPPLPPDISIDSYKAVNNKLLFNLNTAVGAVQHEPVALRSSEEFYLGQLLSMNEDPRQTTILYENDDPSVKFEIMRVTERPSSYADFEQGVAHTVSTQIESADFIQASSTAFVDTIRPNVKYYYTFRAYDMHDHVSYPSAIYEIELVDDEGAVYPRIRTVPLLGDESRKEPTKKLRRFLQIKPQISQTTIDWADPAAQEWGTAHAPVAGTNGMPMGIDDVSIWGKRFKIRLTSKKTGKKIDLNINFKKEYDDQREGIVSGD